MADQEIRHDVAAALEGLRARIAAAALPGAAPKLIAVSKFQPVDAVEAALAAGQRVFGENRVQEGKAKFGPLREDWPDIELHLIGPLQTNKVRDAVAAFDVIQTLDRPRLAEALAAEIARSGRRPRLLVQVNTGDEPQKAGVPTGEADAFIESCRAEHGLAIEGLMCIPPVDEDPSMHFALLADMARRHGLDVLSMGMSADFETAIRFGATHVRIGTAIFGDRPHAPAGTDTGTGGPA
ncbi:YggS family pyridoxal phosphate-dependent enzyme [Arenibaculum pallidiluteum]|uniref:YggS family pyridoxal phosphate-dependent enzyme n=1 Tax=Arenibaculum pallidiluteum TaxID=2812559 RepID=UPI001A95A05F|nr:YggS family pyridoxal phosphate-dependent enzyme [Arenibaculum pallidiluteum]